ncbi:MAG: Ig-like domain-containing protein [Clostridia bacterium]|nr:Ig-like domain-containing protein [Clostridia bacterium]
MKRVVAIFFAIMMTLMLSAPLCFAGTLEIEKTYPKEGQSDLQNVNCGVKIYFNEKVYSKDNAAQNKKCFVLKDGKGKAVPATVVYGTKEANMMMILAKGDLEVNSPYSLEISKDLVAANGDVMKDDVVINFKTRDTSKDTLINMVMMVVMFGGMIFFTSRSAKKQAQKQAAEKGKGRNDKVNPYKVSKETGKSVQEIVEKDRKEKQKRAEAEARKKAKKEAAAAKGKTSHADQEIVSENKRVKGPRPISAGGSTYKTGRKAKAEAEAAAKRAKGATNPKHGKKKK